MKGTQEKESSSNSIPSIIHKAFAYFKGVLTKNSARKSHNLIQDRKPEIISKDPIHEHAWSKNASLEASQKIIPQKFLSPHEEDIIKMKAITLLRLRGLPVKSFSEIQSSSIKTELLSQEESSSRLSVSQTFTPYPGLSMKLKGIIEKGTQRHSRPISESFTLSEESINLFPTPLQYTGWALPSALILAIDCLDQTELLARKKELEQRLSQDQAFLTKAKALLDLKQKTWKVNLNEFLNYHQSLSIVILEASGATDFKERVSNYYTYLGNSQAPLETFLEINQLIAQEVEIDQSKNESIVLEYIHLMKAGITPAVNKLKQGTKDLNAFENKLQLCLFRQLNFFLDELCSEQIDQTALYEVSKRQLLSDIEFFRSS